MYSQYNLYSPSKSVQSPVKSYYSVQSPNRQQQLQQSRQLSRNYSSVMSFENEPQENIKQQTNLLQFCKIKYGADNLELQNLRSQQSQEQESKQEQQDKILRFFSADNEVGKILCVSENGIKQKIIQSYFKSDLEHQNLLTAYGQADIKSYKHFDMVFNYRMDQKQVQKQTISKITPNVINFQNNASVLVHGSSNCGKSTLFFGEKDEKGLAYRINTDLLTHIDLQNQQQQHARNTSHLHKNYSLDVSFYIIYNNSIFDLLRYNTQSLQIQTDFSEQNQRITKIPNLSHQSIEFKEDFGKKIIDLGLKNLFTYSEHLKDPKLYQKSHIVIQFQINKSQNNSIQEQKKIQIIRLADIDFYQKHEELNIDDFKILQQYIAHVQNLSLKADGLFKLSKSSKLTYQLYDSCNENTINALFYCVSTAQTQYQKSLQTIKFMDRYNTRQSQQSISKSPSILRPPLSPPNRDFNASLRNSGNLKDIQLDQLIHDIENFTDQIVSSQYTVNQFSEKEKFDWVQEQELIIQDFSKQLDIEAVGANQNKILNTENALYNAQKILKRIAQGGDGGHHNEMSRVLDREQRIRTLQRERSGGKGSRINQSIEGSPSRLRRMDEIRNKEDRLDKDFARLLERYNQSKQMVDNLCQQNQTQQTPYKKISEIPQAHQESQFYGQRSQQNLKQNFQQDEVSFNKPTKKDHHVSIGGAQEIIEDMTGTKDKHMAKSLKRLKQTINMKETLEKEKLGKIQNLNQDLKIQLNELVHKNQDLEEGLHLKDDLLHKYECEIKNCQEDLLYNIDKIKELKMKEDSFLKLEEQLTEQLMQLKGKLARKKHKLKQLRDVHLEEKSNNNEIHEKREEEINEIKQNLEQESNVRQEIEEKKNNLEEQRNQLQQELNTTTQRTEQLQDTLQKNEEQLQQTTHQLEEELHQKQEQIHKNNILNQKNEELRDTQTQLEAKIAKNKVKYEEEKRQIVEESSEKLQKKKQKTEQLKGQVQIQQDQINNMEKQLLQIETQSSNLKNKNTELIDCIEVQKQREVDLSQELQEVKSQNQNMKEEIDRLNTLISQLENKINVQIDQSHQDNKQISELRQELSISSEEVAKLRDENARLQSQNEYIEKQQEIQINDIEIRMDALISDNKNLKDENQALKEQFQGIRKELNTAEDVSCNFKEKYIKAKSVNKSLRDHIKEVEDKVKDFMHEKDIENREIERKRELQLLQEKKTKTKVKILDDIQNMIRQHKMHNVSHKI